MRRHLTLAPRHIRTLTQILPLVEMSGDQATWRAVIAKLETVGVDHPAAILTLAVSLYRAGDTDCHARITRFYRDIFQRLLRGDPALTIDGGVLHMLLQFLWHGRVDGAIAMLWAMEKAPDKDLSESANILAAGVVTMASARHSADRGSWEAARSPGKRRVAIAIPVWGDAFVDLWCDLGLASLLAPRNRAFLERFDVQVHVHTTPPSWERLNRDQRFQRLSTLVTPVFFDLSILFNSGAPGAAYSGMLIAHWTTMTIARMEGADAVLLVTDYVFSDGYFDYLGDIVEHRTRDAAFGMDLWLGEASIPRIRAGAGPDGDISLTATEIVDMFRHGRSDRVTTYGLSRKNSSVPSDTTRPYALLEDGGVEARSLQPQLLYVSSELLKRMWTARFPATDNGLADAALATLGDTSRMEMLVDVDRMAVATMETDDEDRAARGIFPLREPVDDVVEGMRRVVVRNGFATPGRHWAFGHSLVVRPDGDAPSSSPSILEEVHAALDPIGNDTEQRFFEEVAKPAFEAFLAALPKGK